MNKIKTISNSVIILLFYFITSSFISKFELIVINNNYQEVLFLAFSQIFLFLIPTLYIIYSQSRDEIINNSYNNTIKDKFNSSIILPIKLNSILYILMGVILLFLIQFTNFFTLEFTEKIIPKNYYNTLFELYSNSKIQTEKLIVTNNKYFVLSTFAFLPAFIEETFFRGYFLNNLNKHFGIIPSSVIVSLFFAALHFNPLFIIQYFCISLVLNYIYIKSGSLIIVILIHFVNNFAGIYHNLK